MPSKSTSSSKKSTVPKAPTKKGSAKHQGYTQKDLDDAVAACDPRNPDRITIPKAVVRFGVPKTTIRNHVLDKMSRSEAHEDQQTLAPEEETALANYCQLRGYRGVPLGKQEIIGLATELCGHKVGKNWIYGFQKRHPELKFRWAQRGEAKHASGLNRTNVDSYFKDLEHILATENILPKDIYNLDEKGLEQSGGDLRLRVLVDHAQREPKLHGEEGRQMATILECISAGGFAIPPLLIHPGTEKDGEWVRDNPCNAYVAASPNGWTDADVAAEWLEKVFDPETRPLMSGSSKRLLIVDGHNSHTTLRFLLYAEQNGIIILCLPPHTTHKLQPLDVGVFNFLAKAWSKEVTEAGQAGQRITKFNLLSYYSRARATALTPDIIISSFRKCRIWPLNRQVISDQDLAPADNTTMLTSQPLPAALPTFLELLPTGSSTPDHPPATPNPQNPSPESYPIDPNWNTATIRQLDRPDIPRKHASKKELRLVITTLNTQLDRANSQLRSNFAQMVLMDKENGDIRKRLYGKTPAAWKTTHIKDGSRILSSKEGIDKLAQEYQKKVVSSVLKEGGPIFRSRFKQLEAKEKELVKKFDEDEKQVIKLAEGKLKGLQKEMEASEKRKSRVEDLLHNAEARAAKATAQSVIAKAEADTNKYERELEELTRTISHIEPLLDPALLEFNRVSKARADRLSAIERTEKRYQQAIEQENRQKDAEDALKYAEAARKAKLPRRLADATNAWKIRFQEQEIDEPLTKDDQENVFQSEVGPKLPNGWFMGAQMAADNEVFERYHGEEDINHDLIDPALIAESREIYRSCGQVWDDFL